MKSNTKPALMVRDVATRWNSTSELLERALLLRKALNVLVGLEQHNKPRTARLQRFKLSGPEWELLEQLWPLLNVYLCCLIGLLYADVFVHLLSRHFLTPRNSCLRPTLHSYIK